MDYLEELRQTPQFKDTLLCLDINMLEYLVSVGLKDNLSLSSLVDLFLKSEMFDFYNKSNCFAQTEVDENVRKTTVFLYNAIRPDSFKREVRMYLKADKVVEQLLASN